MFRFEIVKRKKNDESIDFAESPRKYVENEVTIHYKTPVRQEIKEYLSEDELAHRQAEAMKKIYQEERRRKYLQVSNSLQVSSDLKVDVSKALFFWCESRFILLFYYSRDLLCVLNAPEGKVQVSHTVTH